MNVRRHVVINHVAPQGCLEVCTLGIRGRLPRTFGVILFPVFMVTGLLDDGFMEGSCMRAEEGGVMEGEELGKAKGKGKVSRESLVWSDDRRIVRSYIR